MSTAIRGIGNDFPGGVVDATTPRAADLAGDESRPSRPSPTRAAAEQIGAIDSDPSDAFLLRLDPDHRAACDRRLLEAAFATAPAPLSAAATNFRITDNIASKEQG